MNLFNNNNNNNYNILTEKTKNVEFRALTIFILSTTVLILQVCMEVLHRTSLSSSLLALLVSLISILVFWEFCECKFLNKRKAILSYFEVFVLSQIPFMILRALYIYSEDNLLEHFYANTFRLNFNILLFFLTYTIFFIVIQYFIIQYRVNSEIEISKDFFSIFNLQPIPIACFLKQNNSIVMLNKKFTDTFEYSTADIHDMNDWLYNFVDAKSNLLEASKSFPAIEAKVVTKSGKKIDIIVRRETTSDLIIDTYSDVTELNSALSTALIQAEKIEGERKILVKELLNANKALASGAITASIAHELNQPITAMGLNLEYLDLKLKNNQLLKTNGLPVVHKLLSDNKRIGEIIQTLRNIFVEHHEPFYSKSVKSLVESTLLVIEPECDQKNIVIHKNLDPDVTAVFNTDEIRLVLLNLLGNSIAALNQASPTNKSISISLRKSSQFVYLVISDSGPGIPAPMQDSLFSLFTTSKKGHMGLGLWLSKYVLEKNSGDIKYLNIDGKGASFEIRLPC